MGYLPVVHARPDDQVQADAGRRLSDRSGLRHQGRRRLGHRPRQAGQPLTGFGRRAASLAARPFASGSRDGRWPSARPLAGTSASAHVSLIRRLLQPPGARRRRRHGPGLPLLRASSPASAACSAPRASSTSSRCRPSSASSPSAVALLMIGGEFDLSIGSMIGFAGIVIAIPATQWGWPLWAAVLLAFAVAVLVGWINGLHRRHAPACRPSSSRSAACSSCAA